LMTQATETLHEIGKQSGMDEQTVDACVKDQVVLDKLSADKKFAFETLKVDVTPTFFINGEMIKGAMSFEELDATLRPLLKR
jgi:protein-disulfide isomerase